MCILISLLFIGDIPKKSKKKKQGTSDPMSCEDPSYVKDGPFSGMEVSKFHPKTEKSKKKRKSHQDEHTADQSEEVGEALPESKESRKKRKLRYEEDTAVQTEEAAEVIHKVKKIKKKGNDLENISTFQEGEGGGVQEKPCEDTTIKKKKMKKNSFNHSIVEGDIEGGIKVNENSIDPRPHRKKKKCKSLQNSGMEEHSVYVCEVEKDRLETNTFKKKKKQRKSVAEEGDCATMIEEKEEQLKKIISSKEKTNANASLHNDFVHAQEKSISQKKDKRKKSATGAFEGFNRGVKKHTDRTIRNFRSSYADYWHKHTDRTIRNFRSSYADYWHKSRFNEKQKIVLSPYVWRRPAPARPAWVQKKKYIPKYLTIPAQNLEGCQSMEFQFDNHPKVRHYIPRKLMAMNGIRQKLGEMDKVHLKIPNIVFNGSSLYDIRGYGYGIPN